MPSDQHTICACCGEDKPTPLRIDRMGGYVCLTCIDKQIEKLYHLVEVTEEALQPFAQFGEWNVHPEDVYWLSTTQRERVCDWFGPSDFNNAKKAIQ